MPAAKGLPVWWKPPFAVTVLLFGGTYFLFAFIGAWLSVKPVFFPAFWPPSGIYLAALLVTRMRQWPWFVLAALCGNIGFDLSAGTTFPLALVFSLGNSLEAIVGAWLLKRLTAAVLDMEKVRDIVALAVIGAVAGTMISATIGVATLFYSGVSAEWPVRIWIRWWSGHSLSVLLFTPFLLALYYNPKAFSFRSLFPSVSARSALEKTGWSILFLLMLRLIFLETPSDLISFDYLMWPLMIWAALRFKIASILLINLFTALFGVWTVSHSPTIFSVTYAALPYPSISLNFFLIILISSGLVIAAISRERQRNQRAIQESEEQLRSMVESVRDGILVADPATKTVLTANNAMLTMTGYTMKEILKLSVEDLHPAESLVFIFKKFQSAIDGTDPMASNAPVKRKDTAIFYADIHSAPFTFGGRTLLLGVFRDVSERLKSEEALRESERLLKQSQQIAALGHYVFDAKTGAWTCSEGLETIFGIDASFPKTVEGWLSIIHPDDKEAMQDHLLNHVLRDKNKFDMQYRIIRPSDNSQRWMHGLGNLEIDPTGAPVKMFGTIQDITERKHFEAALVQSERRYRSIVDNVNDAFYIHDFDGTILDCNGNACRMLGYGHEELVGASLKKIDSPDEAHLMPARMKKLMIDGRVVFEGAHIRKDGSAVAVNVSGRIVSRNGNGVVQSFVRDISDRKLADENMMKAQKLESLGMLAGGIAHDFNNLLSGIFGNIDLALAESELGNAKPAAKFLAKSMTVFDRARDLTRQLLTFSKGGAPSKKKGDIAQTVRDTVLFALTGSNLKPTFDFEQGIWGCEYDPHQIGQVIENMVINAKHAMPGGGALNVRVDNGTIDLASPTRLAPGPYVKVTIQDYGIGIPEKHLQKIFDPFFTTKQTGSGLGLATSWSIIKRHGGHIDVLSESGRGTTFIIYLPACMGPTQSIIETPDIVKRGSGKVLVMDDEPYIRDVAAQLLAALGYTVETACDGREAIDRYLSALKEKHPFNAVILDLTIPGGMGGKEAAVELKKYDPQALLIASSGYADDPVMADPAAYGFRASISKPYRKADVAYTVSKVVGSV
jgi:PAS domain S-box-containing protein